ncbi:MAG: SDR family NAD(P)-dependent oxidoreductase [Pigmentiphaga sp.]
MTKLEAVQEVEGKVALVTGGTGGIGAALAEALLVAGAARVIVAARSTCVGDHDRRCTRQLDVTSADSVARLAAEFGNEVDILINNAGINTGKRLFQTTLADVRSEMDVNFYGMLNMVQAFCPAMCARGGGAVVNLLSIVAHCNLPLMATYSASKAAAMSLMQGLRGELRRYGVRVYGVFPALVDTPMSAHVPAPKLAPAELARIIVAALASGEEDIYPGTAADTMAAFRRDAKAVERSMAARLLGPAGQGN